MPEAVIVSTARTPIGRANKGSLVDCRPDDLTARIVQAALEKVPELDPQSVEDPILGCGQPGGEAGYNAARVAAILAGMPDVPGVTVNRYCSSSLQAIRMAAHAIRAGEGDVFVCAGVETVSRFQFGAADTGPHNPKFADAENVSRDRANAVIVMSDQRAADLGLTPLARIVASGVTGLNPEIMGLGPIEACRQALARAGMTIDDIDLVEINEAFAAQVIPSAKHLGVP